MLNEIGECGGLKEVTDGSAEWERWVCYDHLYKCVSNSDNNDTAPSPAIPLLMSLAVWST